MNRRNVGVGTEVEGDLHAREDSMRQLMGDDVLRQTREYPRARKWRFFRADKLAAKESLVGLEPCVSVVGEVGIDVELPFVRLPFPACCLSLRPMNESPQRTLEVLNGTHRDRIYH